jgi:hypothetical protein
MQAVVDGHRVRGDLCAETAWADTGEQPMQLLSRWYGFSFTYAGCEIYEK